MQLAEYYIPITLPNLLHTYYIEMELKQLHHIYIHTVLHTIFHYYIPDSKMSSFRQGNVI